MTTLDNNGQGLPCFQVLFQKLIQVDWSDPEQPAKPNDGQITGVNPASYGAFRDLAALGHLTHRQQRIRRVGMALSHWLDFGSVALIAPAQVKESVSQDCAAERPNSCTKS